MPENSRFEGSRAQEQRQKGKEYRKILPFETLSKFIPTQRDPNEIIKAQEVNRVQELLPLRRERMSASPFTFYRGTAAIMAYDLSQQLSSGQQVVLCGDAHINNFGLFLSPERNLIFDLNDFDEAAPGPWEWDLFRLLTSIILGGKELGFNDDQLAEATRSSSKMYRKILRKLSKMSALDRHYVSLDSDEIDAYSVKGNQKILDKTTQKALKENSEKAMAKLMYRDSDGKLKFIENPPVMSHITTEQEAQVHRLFELYRKTTSADVALLLSTFKISDACRRVVGVGSVGTNCFILALTSAEGAGFMLQIKQTSTSVVSLNNTPNKTTPPTLSPEDTNGKRVVEHQHILQAFSDPFLGYFENEGRDYYVRQFKDGKSGFDIKKMDFNEFSRYCSTCAASLARAHSQSPGVHFIVGYTGKKSKFDDAMLKWGLSYAEQVKKDFQKYTNRK